MSYYQFNTRTCYSFGQSTLRADEYAERAAMFSYGGIAFCDDNTYAYPSFTDAALKQNLKPIYGLRIQLASENTHPINACLYVLNERGYLNLCDLLSQKKSLYGTKDLESHREGLALVIDTEDPDFKDEDFLSLVCGLLYDYHRIFADDFYFGIVISSALDKENMGTLYQFLETASYASIAFPKVCYRSKTDAYKTALMAVARAKQKAIDLPKEGPYFLLSGKALQALYRPEDIAGTEALADKIDFTFFKGDRGKLITYQNDDEVLRKTTQDALNDLFGNTVPEIYQQRLDYELSVIRNMAFSSYFLLVSDYVNYARDSGIAVGPGRGSAGGSLVSYLLHIVEIDPIRYGLSFERFLNPKRQTMPDIDIDFDATRRDEIEAYLIRKYGEERVCKIITFSKLKPKSALLLIGPSLGMTDARLKMLTSAIDDRAETFRQAVDPSDWHTRRLRDLLRDPYFKDICVIADGLVGLPNNTSRHAPGVIISEAPIYLNVPMSDGKRGICSYEYGYMERLGYLKCDILSLNDLTFIQAVEDRARQMGETIEDTQSHLEDKATYETLNRLDLAEVFQLESEGMARTIQALKPSHFQDIAALLALYRPSAEAYIADFAARKNGLEPIHYLTPALEPILKETYGVMIYQEQVIEILKAVAGFSASDADLFRRAISKKKKSLMEQYQAQFLEGCRKNGIDGKTAKAIYDDIEKFSDYGFNKSHAYCYSLITYRYLYDKTHYPIAFYQEAIRRTSLSDSKFLRLGKELKGLGYQLMGPDINHSLKDITRFESGKAYLPFSEIANANNAALLDALIDERDRHGSYRDFYEFLSRNRQVLDDKAKRTLSAWIEAGALDSLSRHRKAMKSNLDTDIGFARMGFAASSVPPLTSEDEDLGERLNNEKGALGIILSRRFQEIAFRKGYHTFLVKEDSRLTGDHQVTIINASQEYILHTDVPTLKKNSFILVRADAIRPHRTHIYDAEVIDLGARKAD